VVLETYFWLLLPYQSFENTVDNQPQKCRWNAEWEK